MNEQITQEEIQEIERLTGGKIGTHTFGQNNEHTLENAFLSLQTLIAIIMLLMYTIAAPLFEKYHFHYMHESGVCMIIGVIITSKSLSSNDVFIFCIISVTIPSF